MGIEITPTYLKKGIRFDYVIEQEDPKFRIEKGTVFLSYSSVPHLLFLPPEKSIREMPPSCIERNLLEFDISEKNIAVVFIRSSYKIIMETMGKDKKERTEKTFYKFSGPFHKMKILKT